MNGKALVGGGLSFDFPRKECFLLLFYDSERLFSIVVEYANQVESCFELFKTYFSRFSSVDCTTQGTNHFTVKISQLNVEYLIRSAVRNVNHSSRWVWIYIHSFEVQLL